MGPNTTPAMMSRERPWKSVRFLKLPSSCNSPSLTWRRSSVACACTTKRAARSLTSWKSRTPRRAPRHHYGAENPYARNHSAIGNSVRGDDRGHVLTPNRECDLGHDAVNFDINDSADKLIASADSAELGTPFPYGDLLPWQIQI